MSTTALPVPGSSPPARAPRGPEGLRPADLERRLEAAEALLEEGGRLAIVTFHSLEDRIVKQFLRKRSGGEGAGSRHLPERAAGPQPTFGKPAKAVRPGEAELARNPRARSATLRSAIRTAAPVAASFAPSSPRSSRA